MFKKFFFFFFDEFFYTLIIKSNFWYECYFYIIYIWVYMSDFEGGRTSRLKSSRYLKGR